MKDFQEERNKREKMLKKALIGVGILLIILVISLIVLTVLDSNRNKLLLDKKELPIEKLTYNVGDQTYINLREMAKYFPSFQYSTGEYSLSGTVKQDPSYFHLKSPYEVIQFKKESSEMIKYILIDENYYNFDSKGNKILTKEEIDSGREKIIERQDIDNRTRAKEEFNLTSEVLEINNNQFVPIEDIKYIFNVSFEKSVNQIELYTVEYLEKAYANLLNKSNLSLNPNYQNRRAIIDGYFITTSNLTNPMYGIQTLDKDSFKSQISESYRDLRYVQSNKTIFVINNENSFGLINIDKAIDIIKPGEYKSIEIYLPELDLYKVENVEGRFGIIDASGKKVVHIEYDQIGYDITKFPTEKSGKIFFNSLIPAKKNNRWYIFDLENPNQNYGSLIGGYLDLGYKKPELIMRNSNNQPELSEEQAKELESRGFANLVKENRNASQEENIIRLSLLAKEGFVAVKDLIPEGESILTVPESTGFGGLIVKSKLDTNEYVYYVINADAKVRSKGTPYYPLETPYRRIYKLSVDGIERYYAIAIDRNNTKYELRSEKINQNTNNTSTNTNTNINTNTNTNTNNNIQQNNIVTQDQNIVDQQQVNNDQLQNQNTIINNNNQQVNTIVNQN